MAARESSLTLEKIFGPGGLLATQLPNYEYRPSQLEMAKAVLEAIRNQHHLCVEAGTGTGKTLAYLIPALFSRKRVVVSTATKNLQEQLFFKDIPFLRQYLFPDLSVTYMKGRQNYLCLKKFYEEKPQGIVFGGAQEEWRLLSQWLSQTETGDRAELSWISDDDPLWRHLDARSETCVGQKCSYFNQCSITRMRQKALESDLIVVNHALFFAHLALQSDEIGQILPDYSVLILDEAHEVEDVAAGHFGAQLSNYQVEEFYRDFQKVFSDSSEYDQELADLQRRAALFFESFPGEEGRYSLSFFQKPQGGIVDLRLELVERFQGLRKILETLYHHVQRRTEHPAEADTVVRRLQQLILHLDDAFDLDNSQNVYWFEKRGRGGVFLHVTPIDMAPILREQLFGRTETAILTSATLTADNSFAFLKERLGIPEPAELVVPGEFDYLTQAILYLPREIPEPQSRAYFVHALREIRKLLDITDGHAFLLFTSFQQMNRFYYALAEGVSYPLLRQGDRPKNQLLETFKQTPRAVLCATSSFWQGVDVQGDALRAVVIDKLPFLVPTEPVVAARIRRLQEQGENSFLRYTVPEAIITLRQGLGRLIRSRQDRGVLAIFDSRLRTRSYGELFLKSLPNCPVTDKIGDVKNFFHKTGA